RGYPHRRPPDHDLEHPQRQPRAGDTLMSTATTAPATEAAEEQYRASIWSRIKVGRLVANIALLLIVALWTFPTAGLLISSVRDADQLALSGWWTSLTTSETTGAAALGSAEEQVEENGQYVISGDIL